MTKETTSTEQKLNIYQKLALMRDMVDVAKKNKAGYGYRYADLEEILPRVKAGMKKYGLSLVPKIINPKTEQIIVQTKKNDKAGNPVEQIATEFLTRFTMSYCWIDDASGEAIEIPWYGVGSQSDPAQGFGTALTYSERYFLIDYFQIPVTEGDPEVIRGKIKEAELAEEVALAKQIIGELHKKVGEYLDINPNQRDAVIKLVKKYVKSGDYNKIEDPAIARRLYEEFTKMTTASNKTSEKKGEK